jgi:hypothetical protein
VNISAVAHSVMLQLYLRHDFYNIIFKVKYKLYIASGSAPPPPGKEKFLVRTWVNSVNILRFGPKQIVYFLNITSALRAPSVRN